MAHHYIKQGYFADRTYRLLTRDEGYFSDFLWQLPQLSAAGIGRISLGMMAAESYGKFTEQECQELLAALQARHRIIYDDEWLWVVNYFKYKPGGNASVLINAKNSIAECDSRLIFDGWWKKYGQLDNVKKVIGPMTFAWEVSDAPEDYQPALAGIDAMPAEIHLHRANVDAVWIHYQKVMKSEGFLTPNRRQKILERFRENIVDQGIPRNVGVEDLMRAISNCAKSDWHMGRDPKSQGHKYNSLEDHILSSQEKFLYWLTYEGAHPASPGKTATKGEVVYREESPSPSAKWSGERTPPEEVKAIVKRTVKQLGGAAGPASTERVFK